MELPLQDIVERSTCRTEKNTLIFSEPSHSLESDRLEIIREATLHTVRIACISKTRDYQVGRGVSAVASEQHWAEENRSDNLDWIPFLWESILSK